MFRYSKLFGSTTRVFFIRKKLANLLLTLPVLCILEIHIKIKIYLNYYFHTSLWCLKRFYEGLFSFRLGLGREGLKPKLADASFSDTQLP